MVLVYLGTGIMVEDLKQTCTCHISSEVLKMSVNTRDRPQNQLLHVYVTAVLPKAYPSQYLWLRH